MKKTDCTICEKKEIAVNDTIKINSETYCSACFETHFADQSKLKDKLIEKNIDPTICSSCSEDFGDIELNKISIYPICNDCEIKNKNKTFPTWVKAFFIVVMIIVTGSFFWNWKYYQAYSNIKKSNEYFTKGDYANATRLMSAASEKIPELEDLQTMATYFKGIGFLANDKSGEALIEFNKCKDKVPADYKMNSLIIQAKIGSSFDNQDYNGFLEASKENLAMDSTQVISLASVASAYACIYADKGDTAAKSNAFKFIDKAKAIDSASKEMKEYYNMIEYRIDSRKIIRREAFIKQFPNGWIKN